MKTSVLFVRVAALIIAAFSGTTLFAHDDSLAKSPRLPDDMLDVTQQADDQFAEKDYEAAAATYQSIIKAHPDCLYAWNNLAVVRFQQGHFEQSRDAFIQTLKLAPDDPFCLENISLVYCELKSFSEAIAPLQKLIALNPNNACLHQRLGECYKHLDRPADAEAEFQKAAEIEKNIKPSPILLASPRSRSLIPTTPSH